MGCYSKKHDKSEDIKELELEYDRYEDIEEELKKVRCWNNRIDLAKSSINRAEAEIELVYAEIHNYLKKKKQD